MDNTKYNCRISPDPLLSGDQYKILVGCNIPSDVNELWFISTHLFKCFSRLADAYFADCIAFFIFHSADLTVHLFLLNYAECFFFYFTNIIQFIDLLTKWLTLYHLWFI